MNDQLRVHRQAIVDTGLEMIRRGLVAGTWGNISCRPACLTGQILITPSAKPYDQLYADDLVTVDGDGTILQGRKPSSELALHLAIYRHSAQIRAIVHTHSLYATACAVARKSIPASLEEMIQVVGGAVQVAEYALPGTEQLARNAVAALGDRTCVLLANHGLVSWGTTLDDALLVAQLVEKAAHIHYVAKQLGGAHEIDETEVKLMRSFYLQHYRNSSV